MIQTDIGFYLKTCSDLGSFWCLPHFLCLKYAIARCCTENNLFLNKEYNYFICSPVHNCQSIKPINKQKFI